MEKDQYINIYGIVDEGEIVSKEELSGREEVPPCPEHLSLSWTAEKN